MEGPMFILLNDYYVCSYEDPTELLAAFYADNGYYAQALMLLQDPKTGSWRSNIIARKGDWHEETNVSFILPYGEDEGGWVYDPNYDGLSMSIIIRVNENGDVVSVLDIPDINEDDVFVVTRRYFDGQVDNRVEVASAASLGKAMNTTTISVSTEPSDYVSYIISVDGCVIAHIRN